MTTEIRRQLVENFEVRGLRTTSTNGQLQYEILVTVPRGHHPIVETVVNTEQEFEERFASVIADIREICSRAQS